MKTQALKWLAVAGMGFWLAGCTITLKDQGELSVSGEYRFSLGHTTSTTQSESVATVDVQPLMDWIAELTKESPQSVGEPDN